MAVCNARDLAHYIVDKCTRDDEPVSNLQLQKMMYLIQYIYCRSNGFLMFDDEFEAWPYGPVLPIIYDEYSRYGGRPITLRYRDISNRPFGALTKWLDDGIETLRAKSPWDLVRITHADGSPWDKVWKDGDGYKDTIPNELILRDADGRGRR